VNSPPDVDALFAEIEQLLVAESSAEGLELKRGWINRAIRKARELVELIPTDADAHQMLGVCWYHHPDWNAERSTAAHKHFATAIELNPEHHFAHQFLGYLNFDEQKYEEASPHFRATDFQFFVSIGQTWRALKAMELAFACEIHLGRDLDADAFADYMHEYVTAASSEEVKVARPTELLSCAEKLFAHNGDVTAQPLQRLLAFLEVTGELEQCENAAMKLAWEEAGSDS
jgi:tetratricopeptide (TPR) repeat protein